MFSNPANWHTHSHTSEVHVCQLFSLWGLTWPRSLVSDWPAMCSVTLVFGCTATLTLACTDNLCHQGTSTAFMNATGLTAEPDKVRQGSHKTRVLAKTCRQTGRKHLGSTIAIVFCTAPQFEHKHTHTYTHTYTRTRTRAHTHTHTWTWTTAARIPATPPSRRGKLEEKCQDAQKTNVSG